MTVKERIIQYLNFKHVSKTAFCRSIGVSDSFVSSMRKSMQPDKINSIALKYPDLNTGWLLTGEGPMLKNDFNERPLLEAHDSNANYGRINELLKEKDERIRLLNEMLKMKDEKIREMEEAYKDRLTKKGSRSA